MLLLVAGARLWSGRSHATIKTAEESLDAFEALGDRFDYASINALSTEARQKLERIRPATVAQASRIPGVSPADINILLLLSGR